MNSSKRMVLYTVIGLKKFSNNLGRSDGKQPSLVVGFQPWLKIHRNVFDDENKKNEADVGLSLARTLISASPR